MSIFVEMNNPPVSSNKHKAIKHVFPVLKNLCEDRIFRKLILRGCYQSASELLENATRHLLKTKIQIVTTNLVCHDNAYFEINEKQRLSFDIALDFGEKSLPESLRPIHSDINAKHAVLNPSDRPLVVFDKRGGGLFIYLDVSALPSFKDSDSVDLKKYFWGAMVTHTTNPAKWARSAGVQSSTLNLSRYPSTHYMNEQGVVTSFVYRPLDLV